MIVLPLAGSCTVDTDAGAADLAGRPGVFSAVTDCAYVPRDTAYEINTGPAAGSRWPAPGPRRRDSRSGT